MRHIENKFPYANTLRVYKETVTKKDILAKLRNPQAIYVLFGHSKMNDIFPDSTTFQLTAFVGNTEQSQTISLSLADLKSVDWHQTEKVLLIGCETGRGQEVLGSGFAGIQQSILIAGAKEVLSTLWEIDAYHAVPQILKYLKGWENEAASAYALQKAQVEKINELKAGSRYQAPHPYLWAGFTLSQTTHR